VTIAEQDPLLAWRSEFPILEHTTYLVSHSLGAMPRAAEKRLKEYTDTWASRGVRAWAEGWWRMPVTVGDRVGRIKDPAGNIWWIQTHVEDADPAEMGKRAGDPKFAAAMREVQESLDRETNRRAGWN